MRDFLSKYRIGRKEDCEEFLQHTTSKVVGIRTGIQSLDKQLRGLKGIVGVLGGPKACKSTFVLQVALNAAQEGNSVLFIDRENGLSHMRERIICNQNSVCWGQVCKSDEKRKMELWNGLAELPLVLYTGAFDQQEVEGWLDSLVELTPKDKNILLVLDSLHKLPHDMGEIRMSVDKWLLFLDYLKLKYNRRLVILTTVEKRRGAYDEASKDGGKESGRIEYTLEQQLDMRKCETGDSIIIECTYNRHGPCGESILVDPVYTNKQDPWSFIFKLKERDKGLLL